MSDDQHTVLDTAPSPPGSSKSGAGRSDAPTRLMMGGSILAAIVVIGVVVSIIIAVRGEYAGPLVSTGPDTTSGLETQQPPTEEPRFEQDPTLDMHGRVTYIPLDEDGVLLEQTSPEPGRTSGDVPGGVMFQQIHGNMVVPFSTTDGPTRITDNGVAAGFSRTAQGAVLAASHYIGYMLGEPERRNLVLTDGLVLDPNGVLSATLPQSVTDRGYAPSQYFRVKFNADLTVVEFANPGSTNNRTLVTVLTVVWREDLGWVLKIDPNTFQSGARLEPVDSSWTSW